MHADEANAEKHPRPSAFIRGSPFRTWWLAVSCQERIFATETTEKQTDFAFLRNPIPFVSAFSAPPRFYL
jgi:hypothetical protein